MRKGETRGFLFIVPSLLGLLVFLVIPFIDVVRRSFMDSQASNSVGISNYSSILSNEAFHLAAGNTFKFMCVCIPLLVISSFILALFLKEKTPLNNLFKTGLLVPLAIPVTAAALLWALLFDTSGIVNGTLALFGIESLDWMNSGSAFWVLVGCYVWRNLGYCVILWLAALSAIPHSVYEAAKMDGANKTQSLLKITLPLISPSLFVVLIIALINSFKVYREAYLVAGNYPHESIYLLQHLFNNWFTSLSVGKLAAGGVLLFLAMLVLVFLLYRFWGMKEDLTK